MGDRADHRGWVQRWGPVLVLGLLAVLPSAAIVAQEIEVGRTPSNIRLSLQLDPYELHAETAQDILLQLRTLAPQVGWVWYPYRWSWRYDSERVRLASGAGSTNCRPVNFRVDLDFTPAYPEWVRPTGASDDLIAAWEAFADQITRSWEARRANAVARARQATDAVRSVEERCEALNERMQFIVRTAFDREPPDWLNGSDPAPRLAWPPEGFRHLLAVSSAAPPTPAPPLAGDPDIPVDGAPASAPGTSIVPSPQPWARPTSDLAQAVGLDLRGVGPADGSRGFIVGITYAGDVQFVNGFAEPSAEVPEPMTAEHTFAFRSFTEVLVATLAAALDEGGALDLRAPIAAVLPGLDARLGSATLDQLLSHRAGLDNAPPRDSAAWPDVLDALTDRALFTDPGVLYSHSRYSFGMAVRAIEAATGKAVEQGIQELLLDPLGMENTAFGPRSAPDALEGLPTTYTTAQDLTDFWVSWWRGDIPGSGFEVSQGAPEGGPAGGFQTFHRRMWVDRLGSATRLTLLCSAHGVTSGVLVFPESEAMIVFGSVGGMPLHTLTFLLSLFGEAFGVSNDIYGPGSLDGGGAVGQTPSRCAPKTLTAPRRPADFGAREPAGSWVGRYVNGNWVFALEERDGWLVSPRGPGNAPYDIQRFEGDTYFASFEIPPRVGFPLKLVTDDLGRRYVVLGDRAYLHEEDR